MLDNQEYNLLNKTHDHSKSKAETACGDGLGNLALFIDHVHKLPELKSIL